MQSEFNIEIDTARDLLRVRLAGFFDEPALSSFLAARELAYRQLRCAPHQHLSLIDVREMAIQTQDMVSRWGQVLSDPTYHSKRIAFVIASTLARLQLHRAIGTRDVRYSTDVAEAERWLLSGDRAEAA